MAKDGKVGIVCLRQTAMSKQNGRRMMMSGVRFARWNVNKMGCEMMTFSTILKFHLYNYKKYSFASTYNNKGFPNRCKTPATG